MYLLRTNVPIVPTVPLMLRNQLYAQWHGQVLGADVTHSHSGWPPRQCSTQCIALHGVCIPVVVHAQYP